MIAEYFSNRSWAKEPNNYKNNENCAVITQDGFYNDYDCQGKALYICEQNLGKYT